MFKDFRLLFAVGVMALSFAASARAADTDGRIESSFKNSYVYKTYLRDDQIDIHVKHGVVTLTGTVDQENHRGLAQETAAGLPGVQRVENTLEVRGGKVPEQSDAWLAMKVKAALVFHRSVSGLRTQVETKDGIVTLRGEAESQAEKDLAAEYAKDVEGVKSVRNDMVIAKNDNPDQIDKQTFKEKIDDASITAQVKTALLSHRSTSAIGTKVETRDGVVTVSGNAKNQAEKDLVTKLVTDIKGVDRVVNNMNVS